MRLPSATWVLAFLTVTPALTTAMGGDAPGAASLRTAGSRLGQPAQEPQQESTEKVPVPQPTPEELAPEDVADTWVELEVFEGVPVAVFEEYEDGVNTRRACTRSDRDARVHHGPDWTFWPNAHPRVQRLWIDGELHGPYRSWTAAGTLHEKGDYDGGERIGVWLRYKEQRLVARNEYAAGRPHGFFQGWFKSGKAREESRWTEGTQTGRERRWNVAGQLILEAHWTAGRLDGPWRDAFPQGGARKSEGRFCVGAKCGAWTEWDRQGQKVLEETYVDGRLEGAQRKWRTDGSLETEIEHVEGRVEGAYVAWFASGQKQMEGRMRDGKREGRWHYWRLDGSVHAGWSGVYEDDQKVGD